ncbi:aldolase [Calocera viscosa TUFC12733]|uniref:Aldolase n=1 Tax=Calocera viscosa (strain TUFC12733) TaxID=1330018 RepID=A0A167GT17_CALVF|nr:aldolase [Calocera viscosa TUFC12733]
MTYTSTIVVPNTAPPALTIPTKEQLPKGRTLYHKLEELTNIDVDTADADVAKAMPLKPHNQTSNQRIILHAMIHPDNKDIFESTVREHADKGWEYIFDLIGVRCVARNLPNVQDRVLLQTSPAKAYDYDALLAQVRRFAQFFEAERVPRNKFAIKIPCTGPGMAAAATAVKDGITMLGTTLFSLEAAIAASQAGCTVISPYYNEIKARFDASRWPDVEDPATQHPMSFRIRHILETFRTMYEETKKKQPLIVCASYFNIKEAFATAELGCFSLTLPAPIMLELASTPDSSPPASTPKDPWAFYGPTPPRFASMSNKDPLAGLGWNGKLADYKIDYIANNGKALEEANQDPIAQERIADALKLFQDFEDEAVRTINAKIAELGLAN